MAMQLEAAEAPRMRPEAAARASGAIHPTPAEVPHARITAAPPACHA